MKAGDTAYLVESNRVIRKVTVLNTSGGLYLIRFNDSGGGIRVKAHRLFATEEEAQKSIGISPKKEEPRRYRSPYDYDH